MKLVVIGASGMLARPVIRHLDEAGFRLRLFSRTVNRSMVDKDYEMIRGDVFSPADLERAVEGCDGIHINLSDANEALAVRAIVDVARQKKVQRISYISGCTVSDRNRWFPMIENKYQAEQCIIKSGIPYMIFRPSWFFESLGLMIRDGKAILPGKQPHPYHWVAADDYARMVTTAYKKPEALNTIFFIHGSGQHRMGDLLEKYCKQCHPGIRKVSNVPLWLMKTMGMITGNKGIRDAASLFAYFEKVREMGDPSDTNKLLGKPELSFETWMRSLA